MARPRATLFVVPLVWALIGASIGEVTTIGATEVTEADSATGAAGQSQAARRVISLVPAATETLFAVGAGDRVVGVSSHDTWPPEVRTRPRVGALLDPDLERILVLRPDLVVVDPGHRTLTARLEAAGVAHAAYATGSVADALEAIGRLGHLVGHGPEGEALAKRVERELEAVRESVTGSRRRVLLVFGRRTGSFANLFVSGGVGFLHELQEIAGGDNVFAEVQHASFKAGLEAVLARRPEVVVEARPQIDDADPAIAEIIADWATLPGFGDARVVIATGAAFVVPGPRMPEAARSLAELLAER